ncbi:hypothetical protein [Myroides fluvii]|uniref:hypothetical protein n=1 Tax=Myroides fluvii TaxID=2572594 RepID=UPI00131D877F|nr:hypothetical protein [Myroides fluvii]
MKKILLLGVLIIAVKAMAQQTHKITVVAAITEKNFGKNYYVEDEDEELYELLNSTTMFFSYDQSGRIIHIGESKESTFKPQLAYNEQNEIISELPHIKFIYKNGLLYQIKKEESPVNRLPHYIVITYTYNKNNLITETEITTYWNGESNIIKKYEYLYDDKNRIKTIVDKSPIIRNKSYREKEGIDSVMLSYDDAKEPFDNFPYFFSFYYSGLEHLMFTSYKSKNNITCMENKTNYSYIDYTYNSQNLPLTATVYRFDQEDSYGGMDDYYDDEDDTYRLFGGMYTVFEFQYAELEIVKNNK